jgi:hypothetical protein
VTCPPLRRTGSGLFDIIPAQIFRQRERAPAALITRAVGIDLASGGRRIRLREYLRVVPETTMIRSTRISGTRWRTKRRATGMPGRGDDRRHRRERPAVILDV